MQASPTSEKNASTQEQRYKIVTKSTRNSNQSTSLVNSKKLADFSGTSQRSLAQALKTYDVPVGPGSYNLPPLISNN
jgi:hypothetical protein